MYEALFPRIRRIYSALFSVAEIEKSPALQWAVGAIISSYAMSFTYWFYRTDTTVEGIREGTNICWPYFQSCQEFLFLHTLPHGYSQPLLYMLFFGLMLLSIYGLYKRDYFLAHVALLPLFLWHFSVSFFVTSSLLGNYDYYLIVFAITLLFLPYKTYFLRLFIVLLYFISVVAKIHPAWVIGSYFSALHTGLPLFSKWAIPFWTNLVMFMETVGTWFLLSNNRYLQRGALVFFVVFHLYSGLLVGYHYPAVVLPFLLIFFGMFNQHVPPPLQRRAIAGWLLVVFLVCAPFIPRSISGDEKLTLEGNSYGLFMFESNHQCISEAQVIFAEGHTRAIDKQSINSRYRCDPYYFWSQLKRECLGSGVERMSWTFDHSINGGPFYRIVNVSDICTLDYKPFGHNEWIQAEGAEVVGYPVENVYY